MTLFEAAYHKSVTCWTWRLLSIPEWVS